MRCSAGTMLAVMRASPSVGLAGRQSEGEGIVVHVAFLSSA